MVLGHSQLYRKYFGKIENWQHEFIDRGHELNRKEIQESMHNRKHVIYFWTFGKSVRRSSRSAFGRPTGNNVSGHY